MPLVQTATDNTYTSWGPIYTMCAGTTATNTFTIDYNVLCGSTATTAWTVTNPWYQYGIDAAGELAQPAPSIIMGDDRAWQRWNGEYFEAVQSAAMTEDEQHQWRLRNEERMNKQRLAAEKAKQLFLDWLSPEQRTQFERDAIVEVLARKSGRRYRIRAGESSGRHGNIFELDPRGREVAKLCCAPGGMDLPHFDAVCGQKLALELDEDEFRRMANFTPMVNDYRRAVA